MENYTKNLLNEAMGYFEHGVDLLRRALGRIDAAEDFKPALRLVTFPGDIRATPGESEQGAVVRSQKETTLLFTDEEVSKMPRKFRKIFRTKKQTAHVRRKDGDVYEIRMQIDGHRITASAKYLDLAKERFIKKLREYNEHGARDKKEGAQIAPNVAALSVSDYALHYLETFKRQYVSEKHFSNLCGIVRRHIARFFGDKLMRDLTATDCQKLLNELSEQGKGRTLEEVNNLLSWISAAAVADRILPADVMEQVQTLPHKRTTGKVIPRQYVRAFLDRAPQSAGELCLWLLIYTGMRPCELSALTFDDRDFITIVTAKKKKWEDQETRRFPLHPRLLPYIEAIRAALPVHYRVIARTFKRNFPAEYRLYDVRHTFATIAQEAHCYKSLGRLRHGAQRKQQRDGQGIHALGGRMAARRNGKNRILGVPARVIAPHVRPIF